MFMHIKLTNRGSRCHATEPAFFHSDVCLERTARGLGQRLVSSCLAQPLLDRWRNHVDGITSGDKHLRRIRHRGNFDERVTQLRRVIGLRAVIGRPHVLGCALRRVVLDDLADPSDILRVELVRPTLNRV